MNEFEISETAIPASNDIAEGRPSTGLALRTLRALERQGLRLDHGKLKKRCAEDSWWLAQGEEVAGPVDFKFILDRLLQGGGPLQFAPVTETGTEEEQQWRVLDYQPLWLRPFASRCWTAGFWLTLLVLGHGTLQLLTSGLLEWLLLSVYWAGAAGWIGWTLFGNSVRRFPMLKVLQVLAVCVALLGVIAGGIQWVSGASNQNAPATQAQTVASANDPESPGLVERPAENVVSIAAPEEAQEPEASVPEAVVAADKVALVAEPLSSQPAEVVASAEATKTLSPGFSRAVASPDSTEAAASPEPSTPEIADLGRELAGSPQEWPKTSVLKREVEFDAMVGSHKVGTLIAPAGIRVQVKTVGDRKVEVAFQNATRVIEIEATDVLDQFLRNKTATQSELARVETPTPETPASKPAPRGTTASAPTETEEPSYFGQPRAAM